MRQGVGDRAIRSNFLQRVSRKHFITKKDIDNIRVKVKDTLVMRHKSDPTSVSIAKNSIIITILVEHFTCIIFNVGILSSCRVAAGKFQSYYDLQVSGCHESSLSKSNLRFICFSSAN